MNNDLIKSIHNFELESINFLHNKIRRYSPNISIIKESVKLDNLYNISFEYLDESRNKQTYTYNYFNDLCDYFKQKTNES